MSGIFGVVGSSRKTDLATLISEMSVVMSHRDWFVAEHYMESDAGVALGRIGIGIFNQAQQPIWNSSGTIALVMAGELYNRAEIRGGNPSLSDEQLALAVYEETGDGFISRLNGAFVIGIYDKRKNCVLVVNDRFGLYPLFYTCHNDQLIFAPEVKGILCHKDVSKQLDLTALAQYIRFQHLLGERTFFDGIKLLPSSSMLCYDISSASCAVRSYWTFDEVPYRPEIRFDEAVEEAGYIFRQIIKRLSSDAYRPGVYLSGGLDSRSILGLIDHRPVVSLTYGAQNSRDVYYAKRIANTVGSDHHWFDFPDGKWVGEVADFHLDLTEGFHSWIHAHGMSTLPCARELMDVNLTGWDGGTLMGHDDNLEPLQSSPVDDMAFITRVFFMFNQKFTWPSITEEEEDLLYSDATRDQMLGRAFESFKEELSKYLLYRKDVRGEYFYIDNHCRRLTQNFVVFTRSHVEVRIPFFDYHLFDFLYSLPIQVREHRRLYRAMIQREMPQMTYIPYDHDEFLPTTQSLVRGVHAEIVKFKRRVNRHIRKVFPERRPLYADYEAYLRTDLREWAENILYDRRTSERGIFDPIFLRSLMKRHLSGLEEWTVGKIAPLITYEMMLRRFYD